MDLILVLALLTPPFAAGMLALVLRHAPARVAWLNVLTMPVSLVAAGAIAVRLATGGTSVMVGEVWRIDALSALLAVLIASVATLAVALGPGSERDHPWRDAEIRT